MFVVARASFSIGGWEVLYLMHPFTSGGGGGGGVYGPPLSIPATLHPFTSGVCVWVWVWGGVWSTSVYTSHTAYTCNTSYPHIPPAPVVHVHVCDMGKVMHMCVHVWYGESDALFK